MLVLTLGLATATVCGANTYTVTATADSGAGTLRQAILDANANSGADTIAFNIVGSGVHTIAPASALPAITGPVTIDGYTQSGSIANTNPTGQGLNTVLQIEIDGTNGCATACLDVQADDVTIRGLVINHNAGVGILTTNAHQNLVVEGCFLGTDPSGAQALEPYGGALSVRNHTNARIGGTTPAARNLISGGNLNGYQITLGSGQAVTGTKIEGNLVGTDVTGLVKLAPSGMAPLLLSSGSNNTIGGTSAGARNVMVNGIATQSATGNFIQGNFLGIDVTGKTNLGCYGFCIQLNSANNTIGGSAPGAGNRIGGAISEGIDIIGDGNVVQGNFIGTDESGTVRIGNSGYGIYVRASNVLIGGTGAGEANVIANNGGSAAIGVHGTHVGVTIRGNSIFDNPSDLPTDGLGIDLLEGSFDTKGVTYNDAGDGDTGPNGLQNYPLITSVTYGASTTTVAGTLDSQASTVYDLDFYSNPVCAARPQELPEGKTYLGAIQVTTDGSGNATFNADLPVAAANGSPITATATDPGGSTSEFTPRFVVSVQPNVGSPSGQVAVHVHGTAFENGATVTVGGVPATNVSVNDANNILCDFPALPAGSINPVAVQNPSGGLSGTLPNGWIVYFNDVPPGNQFLTQVTQLVANGITAGVGGGNYGVANPTLRQQMAVFLLKSKYGVCYTPPPCTGVFPDVPCSSNFAPWIEALSAEGITGGCGGGNYCPTNPVRRDQMAVFLLKAKHGSTYAPPPCTGMFADVTCPSTFANWIEQLAAEQITGGCGGGNYCPLNNVTRGQMAAFLVKTFSLP
jgi:hypothetical protein